MEFRMAHRVLAPSDGAGLIARIRLVVAIYSAQTAL